MPSDDALLLTIQQVRERTQLGATTLYKEMGSGRLRSVKIGRSRRIPATALEEFIARLVQEAAEERGDGQL